MQGDVGDGHVSCNEQEGGKGCPHKLSEMELMEGALMSGRFVLAAFSALQPGAAHFGDEPLEAFFAIPQGKRAHFFAI